jgi:dipeptidyl-peptidase-4
VRDNNLYVVDLADMKETPGHHRRRMEQGAQRRTGLGIRGGIQLREGLRWSPNGTKILYLRSDESAVKEFDLTCTRGSSTPSEYRFKYPKAGEVNSTVSLHCYDLATEDNSAMPLGTAETDIYLPRFGHRMTMRCGSCA